jgi:hypothetical protein
MKALLLCIASGIGLYFIAGLGLLVIESRNKELEQDLRGKR